MDQSAHEGNCRRRCDESAAPVKVLFTGRANGGSWQIRGVQMAAGIGEAIPMASAERCREADVIVGVKRIPPELLENIRRSGKPWAWDIVDAYPQPECSRWNEQEARFWFEERLRSLRPDFLIWPTKRMQRDLGNEAAGAIIPHHFRPGLGKNPIREALGCVGYEGAEPYLGHWAGVLEVEARRVGAKFLVNPPSLTECDAVVAFRSGTADCYATRHWKSNVKLANAQGSGTPFLGQPDCGYLETASGAELWCETREEIRCALELLRSRATREKISSRMLGHAISLADCQAALLRVLRGLA